MNTTPKQNSDDQEIDLSQISRKLGGAYDRFLSWIFRGFLFVKKNIIIIAILFFIGAGLGFYLDRTTTVYNHEIIVRPNFGSAEYTYSKVDLIMAKIKEKDYGYLKAIGISQPDIISEISIEPITDVYTFIENREQNFELIKLMAENGDIAKIIKDPTTSINYTNHRIKITTDGKAERSVVIEPILKFLNQSDYFDLVKKSVVESVKLKIEENKKTIGQIDSLLSNFSSNVRASNDRLTYYNNENTQLNDVLETKNQLIAEQSNRKLELIAYDQIVKESSEVQNIKNTKSLNGKMKYLLPILFVGFFMFVRLIRAFYRSQMTKINNQNTIY